jgi:hypothetical protein
MEVCVQKTLPNGVSSRGPGGRFDSPLQKSEIRGLFSSQIPLIPPSAAMMVFGVFAFSNPAGCC